MALAGLRRGLRRSSLFGRPSPPPAQTHNADVAPANEETREKEEEKTRQSKVHHQMEAVGRAGSASVANTSQEELQHRYTPIILLLFIKIK